MEEVEVRFKNVLGKTAKERKMKRNKESEERLSHNRFAVLENEELKEDFTRNSSSANVKVLQKSFDKKRKTKKRKEKGKFKIRSVNIISSEGKYPTVVRCKQCFRSHFPSKTACKFYIQR